MASKTVFVTVGTTSFDDLITSVYQEDILHLLCEKGYTKVILQIGRGDISPKEGYKCGIHVECFRYKPSIKKNFESADLIISHAGAGSCIEALESRKPLLAVVNEKLMDNHQVELAEALSAENFCSWCYPSGLYEAIKNLNPFFKKYTSGAPEKLASYVDSKFILKS